jgi:hypothetical protein
VYMYGGVRAQSGLYHGGIVSYLRRDAGGASVWRVRWRIVYASFGKLFKDTPLFIC